MFNKNFLWCLTVVFYGWGEGHQGWFLFSNVCFPLFSVTDWMLFLQLEKSDMIQRASDVYDK